MSIYTIADLHLSFANSKPMDIFGENWKNHEQKIKDNWLKKVRNSDTVILPGDFSWATYIEDAKLDFEFINSLPGKKILLKGNHDYWWTTLKSMREFLKNNNFNSIDFLYNNSYCIENKIIVGTRGWMLQDNEENRKMINRENERLKLSINNAIENFGDDKEIIAFMHYPPLANQQLERNEHLEFYKTLKSNNIGKCYYGHLHGKSHNEAIEGDIYGVEFKLVSADYLDFDLVEV
ncbi:MAG: serine/threonine protein phosphatase [Clostridiales bacterium]|nr:serine/threonine protein phosphatase [Clostridiales bacterium]